MRKALFTFAMAAALTATPAFAQEGVGPSAGDYELLLGAGGSNDNDFESSTFNLDGTLGYYFTDRLEGVLRQTADYNDTQGGDKWAGSTRIGAAYHFDLQSVRPFVGADIGYIYGDAANDSFVAAVTGGAKWYVKSETFLFGRADYEWFFDSGSDADDTFDDGRFLYTVGIGFNF